MASISEFLDLWEAISEPFFVLGVFPLQTFVAAEPQGIQPRGSRSAKLWVHTIYGKNKRFSNPPNGPMQPLWGPFRRIRPWEKTPGTCRTRSAPRSCNPDPHEPISEPCFDCCQPATCARGLRERENMRSAHVSARQKMKNGSETDS